jgi:hypothetical protein
LARYQPDPQRLESLDGCCLDNATPVGSATVQGLLELATNAETQAGSDTARAVTPAGLQSKVSDSTSTTSSTTIASSTAVKSAYDLANAALPKSGGTVTGNLEIGTSGSLTFEGATADAFETTLAVVDPTADRTITFPDTTGTVVTTGDTGTVTSAMIANSTIVDADISASAEIAVSKLADGAARQLLQTDAAGTGVEWTTNVDVPGTLDVTGTTTLDSTLSIPLGSAASPTVFFTGDSNTGIYSPGADQVAISTNGTGRLFVDASGNVGIGASAVSNRKLTIDGGASYAIQRFTASVTEFCKIEFGDSSSVAAGQLVYDNANNSFSIVTNDTERLRITSAGLVGVGTSAPAYTLVAKGGVATTGIVASIINPVSGGNSKIHFTDDATYNWTAGTVGNAFAITPSEASTSSGTPALYINSSGRVGIGTTSPEGKLEVSAGNAEGLRLSSPSYLSTSQGPWIAFNGGPSAGWDLARVQGIRGGGNAEGALVFYTNNGGGAPGTISEKARIDETGRLLVGTSSSRGNWFNTTFADPLVQLEGSSSTRLSITRNDNSDNSGELMLGNSRSSAYAVLSNNDNLGRISFQGADGSEMVAGAYIQCFVDGTPGANDMPGRLVFSTTADGASSPTERMRIDSTGLMTLAGPGIKFPATQVASADPNTLDDYEEGTWTPTIGGTATYSLQSGFYTKVGRLVCIQFAIGITTLGTGSTTQISGLPFNASSTNSAGSCHYFNSLATNVVRLVPEVNTSLAGKIVFSALTAAGGSTLGVTIFQNATNVHGTVCYITT